MDFLSVAFPVDPAVLLKLFGTVSTVVLGWVVSRARPPQSEGATFIGYHRGALRVLTGVTLGAAIACAASFWWGPGFLSVLLIFHTVGLGLFTCYALRLGLVYTEEGLLVRRFFGSWRPQKWSDVEWVRDFSQEGKKLQICFRDGSKTAVTSMMPGWDDFLVTLAQRSGEKIPRLVRSDGEVFDLVPHPRGPNPTLEEAVEDRLEHEYRRGASQLLEDLRATSLTGSAEADALAHLAILHLMAGDHALLPGLLESARKDVPALLKKAGLAQPDFRRVLRQRGTL